MADPIKVLGEIKSRRDTTLRAIVGTIPFASWLGVTFDRRGDELTAIMPYLHQNIGNPALPALHGGAIAAFLELASVVQLTWTRSWADMEEGRILPDAALPETVPRLPKTIDFTIDYLRPGLARDAYARARVVRSGRRYASVQVEAWQDNRERLFAQATGHFLMPLEA
ncbi:PaaI family thioesterase [Paracoccus sp. (in: a-proteobacteria)]|uniref:PaaI family thioesterase n=1 Tax=Paracoccus sp. TaxID=267 RepID=UPI00289C1E0A|nr:PaaI family thioesterase [Paracoccus sp. (in: a-proteobacteria)]